MSSTNRGVFAGCLILTMFFTTGCDESTLGNTGDPLTPEEVIDIVSALTEVGMAGADFESEHETWGGTMDVTDSCGSSGGFFSVEGTFSGQQDLETEEASISVESFVDFFGCDIGWAAIDGDPGVNVDSDTQFSGGLGLDGYQFDLDGAFSFETDDERAGRCAIDFRMEFTNDEELEEPLVLSGSACGLPADEIDPEEFF